MSNEDKELQEQTQIAMELMRGPGLNHTAFTKEVLGKNKVDNKDKSETREAYDKILLFLRKEYGDSVYKDGHDHFLKEESIEDLKARIVQLEEENAELKAEIQKGPMIIHDDGKRTWRYNQLTGESKQVSTAEAKLLDPKVWKGYPKPGK